MENEEKLIEIFIKDGSDWQQFNPVTDFIITRREIIIYFVLPVSQFVSEEYYISKNFTKIDNLKLIKP